MTFITRIDTPVTDTIKFNEDTRISSNLSISLNCDVTGVLNIDGTTTFGNSSLDKVIIDAGQVISTHQTLPIIITNSSSTDINVNNNTFVIEGTTKTIGIGLNTPLELFHVNTGTISAFQGNTNFGNGALFFNQANKRIGINKTGPSVELDVAGDVLMPGLLVDSSDSTVGMPNRSGDSLGTTPPLHISVGTSVPNKKIDTDAIIVTEKRTSNVMQIITASGSTNYGGIMFTGAPSAGSAANKHWAMFANWGGAGIGTQGDLCFGFINSSSAVPFNDCISNTIGYLRYDVNVSTIDFTGQHLCLPYENDLNFYQDKIGLIVSAAGLYCPTLEPNDGDAIISIDESLPKVSLANKRNDKKVFGVISEVEQQQEKRKYSIGRFASVYKKRENDHRLIINSLGEGGIWVCNINGNLENGDYITSCEVPGYGMKQDLDDLANYTVAKITCDCNFDLNSGTYVCEEFQFNDSTYRRAFVGCTYHCG